MAIRIFVAMAVIVISKIFHAKSGMAFGLKRGQGNRVMREEIHRWRKAHSDRKHEREKQTPVRDRPWLNHHPTRYS